MQCHDSSNQVAQSIRATGKDGQSSMEALHANAAHQQGILSAAVAILEMAAGSGSFDEQGQLQVTEDHVQATLTVAARLVELSLQIREVLRGPVDAAMIQSSESEGEQFKPVQVPAPQKRFAPPVATQAQATSQPSKEETVEDEDHVPVSVPECCGRLPPDRNQKRKASEAAASPSQGLASLPEAFSLCPRLGQVNLSTRRGSETTVLLRGWSATTTNQVLYHNEAMRCCRVSIREISKRRSLWHDRDAGRGDPGDDVPQGVEGDDPPAEEVAVAVPQPATPPTGRC
eukprot:s250_g3.t1